MAIKSFQEQLVALFNTKNSSLPQALTVADVDFGAVATLEGGTAGRNSKLTITAKAESVHFSSALELHYIRLAAAVIGAKAVTDDQADWDTDEEVLAFVNADLIAAGKTEDAFALTDLTIERTDGEDGKKVITVNVKDGNIKYLPGVLATYTVTQEIVKTVLSTTDGELDGFKAELDASV